ncbi:MAG: adaptor protein MecA [Streptococcaceae bacterium]|jgi:adapter protein MecA 1/2|nr:adaptor protein MecA [Streptococcaceae bacterium]
MDYSYENDRTLRIRLSFQDLKEHEMHLTDFLTEQDKVETLFYDLIDEMDLEEFFQNPAFMSFQIRPHANGIDLLVSDDDEGFKDMTVNDMAYELEEFMKSVTSATGRTDLFLDEGEKEPIKSRVKRKKEVVPEPDFVYYTLRFENFETIITLAKTLSVTMDESELYEYQGSFYLAVLDNQKERGKEAMLAIRSLMLEYAEQAPLSREHLREHGRVILSSQALESLKKI